MLTDCSSRFPEQLHYLLLSSPNCVVFTVKYYLKLSLPVLRLKHNDFTIFYFNVNYGLG